MQADTRRGRWRSVIAATAMSMVLGSTMGVSAAAAQDAPTDGVTMSVVPTPGWTATGVMVKAGTDVDISASGTIHFGQPPIDLMPPPAFPGDRNAKRSPAQGTSGRCRASTATH